MQKAFKAQAKWSFLTWGSINKLLKIWGPLRPPENFYMHFHKKESTAYIRFSQSHPWPRIKSHCHNTFFLYLCLLNPAWWSWLAYLSPLLFLEKASESDKDPGHLNHPLHLGRLRCICDDPCCHFQIHRGVDGPGVHLLCGGHSHYGGLWWFCGR